MQTKVFFIIPLIRPSSLMTIRHTIRMLIPVLLLTACAPPLHRVPVAASSEQSFQSGMRVAVSRYPVPDFVAMTPGKATLGMLGALVAVSRGNSFIQDNGIADPAIQIGDRIRADLARKYNLTESGPAENLLPDDSLATIVKSYSTSDFVVAVKTIGWSYRYMPVNWDSYHVAYAARARIIDVKNSRIIAEDFCGGTTKELSDAVSYEKMTRNHGEFLRAKFSTYAAECAAGMAKHMLKIDSPISNDVAVTDVAISSQPGKPENGPAVLDVNTPLPYLKPRGQEYFKEFLTKPLPRAFAISDTAHYAAAWGDRPKDPSKPIDIKERALQNCREVAHKDCILYMVNDEIVYKK